MKWQKLDEESLESLKTGEYFLVYCDSSWEYPYDVIKFLDLKDCGLTRKEMRQHWYSILNDPKDGYTNEDMLDAYDYYCLIERTNYND
jgi:hypothetical protein